MNIPLSTGVRQLPQFYIPIAIHSNHAFPIDGTKYLAYTELLDRDKSTREVHGTQRKIFSFDMDVNKKFITPNKKKIKILIFYDLETTVGTLMTPYMCSYVQVREDNLNDPESYRDRVRVICARTFNDDVIGKFVDYLEENVRHPHPQYQVTYQVHAFNGSKFDHLFLLKQLSDRFRYYILHGSTTNVKFMHIDFKNGNSLELVDTRLATGSGSLNQFCRQMGVEGKLECELIKNIKTAQDWYSLSFEQEEEIVRYCKRDVVIMVQAFGVFNRQMAQVYDELAQTYQLIGRTDVNPWLRRLFVKNTLAQTAHFIVHNVIRSHRVKPLDDLDIY